MSLELVKMRRLRSVPLAAAMAVAVVLIASMTTFSADYRDRAPVDGAELWGQGLLQFVLAVALTSPLLVAILASRQVDVEHQANGWIMARTAATSSSRLLMNKFGLLALLVTALTVVEMLGVCTVHRLAGNTAAAPDLRWLTFTALASLVSVAFTAAHLWVAARWSNQLVGLAIGVLGSFAGLFSLLLPPWTAAVTPWGYYALSSPVRMDGLTGALSTTTPPYALLAAMLIAVAGLSTWAMRRLDTRELT